MEMFSRPSLHERMCRMWGSNAGATCMPSEHASDPATAPGYWTLVAVLFVCVFHIKYVYSRHVKYHFFLVTFTNFLLKNAVLRSVTIFFL